MSTALTLAGLAIVAVVLLKDWGHRRATPLGLLRPLLVAAVVVPFVMPGWDMSGGGLVLEIVGLLAGAAIGVLASSFLKVSVDKDGQAWTDAGVAYAAVWIVYTVARQVFIYGCEHWYSRSLGMFLIGNHISVAAFADSIMFLSLAPIVSNRLAILIRSRRQTVAHPAGRAAAGSARS
ncbi:hypothetical protein [Microbispora sp. ATCC PTA-5024]|uniref:hypothetical protein n=1 Tax=Microbispora sp. ATCC PTA-5024 TaxID=316330 RepID=UPI0003DCEC8C|nr:hypothetical protein [Microbispora sp. ATCC PTA-5024]ETK34887.1 hypothetical protein MPTA5024_16835 [Microbispora sp. ATCC PTA-5024]